VHLFELFESAELPRTPVYALVGSDRFLQRIARERIEQAWGEGDVMAGDAIEWRDLGDRLRTRSLFEQGAARLVVVDEADRFVTAHREAVESYCQAPADSAVLVLCLSKLPANTRLAKIITKHGARIDCAEPTTARGKRTQPDTRRTQRWLQRWSEERHGRKLTAGAAALVWERMGPNFGMVDQELARLSLYCDRTIDEKLARAQCGGWRKRTTWEMIDAALDGRTAEALRQLQRLFDAGEVAMSIFGQLSWSLRRYADAAATFDLEARRGNRPSLQGAVRQAGFRWDREIAAAQTRLRRLGRARAMRLHAELLTLDLKLKSTHSRAGLDQQAVRDFLLRLAAL